MKNDTAHSNAAPRVEESNEEIAIFDEDGALSRDFLLRRGFCCENGCKNCPYGFHETRRASKGQQGES